jgi:hypothetical protein
MAEADVADAVASFDQGFIAMRTGCGRPASGDPLPA